MPVVFVAACAAGPVHAPRPDDADELPASAERDYAIWLGGARVGIAHETERWSPAGVTLLRTEAMRFLRGEVPIAIATTIEITADRALIPSRVTWTERAQTVRRGEALRDATGWTIAITGGDGSDDGDRGGGAARRLPAAAIPAELAPLILRRDGRFAGPVFLPARGFVAGSGRIEPVAPRRLVARLVIESGAAAAIPATAEATIDLGDDAMPVRVVDGEGVIATRITAAEAQAPFSPVDLIAATSIPLAGSPHSSTQQASGTHDGSATSRAGSTARPHLVLDDDLAIPPLPGQTSRATPEGIELALSPRFGGGLPPGAPGADRTREIAALVTRIHHRIAPDLAATPPTSTRMAAAATAGDCTTFALAYAAVAGERAIPTRLVTGYRVEADRLVRHRWAVSWTGRTWIAVDAAFGAVPAGGDLVGLAIHDADDIGLLAGEAALTHLRAARWQSR
jgi:hypothetical protein